VCAVPDEASGQSLAERNVDRPYKAHSGAGHIVGYGKDGNRHSGAPICNLDTVEALARIQGVTQGEGGVICRVLDRQPRNGPARR